MLLKCMLASPVVDYKYFSPFYFMVDFQNQVGFHKCHTFPLNVSDCFCSFMRGGSPCKLTCLWTTTNTGLFYLLVSQSFTMLSKEPEISWCSWVGDHFTDVTQPVWEVRDRRTKEPSEQKEEKPQTSADAETSTLKVCTKSSAIAVQVKC